MPHASCYRPINDQDPSPGHSCSCKVVPVKGGSPMGTINDRVGTRPIFGDEDEHFICCPGLIADETSRHSIHLGQMLETVGTWPAQEFPASRQVCGRVDKPESLA